MRYKFWTFYDENDEYLFASDVKGPVPVGLKVKAGGKNYVVWYSEEGRRGNNARLELDETSPMDQETTR